jgi:glycosyltransferase involved in cell wall biosynthesis
LNLVTTIIPAYNAEAFVGRAIDSALNQHHPQQIVVIDDGSTDDTARLVAAYGDAVELIRQPNGGVSSARNRGIDVARGDFIAFLDADDVWYPEKLTKQLALFAADPALGTVSCDERHVSVTGEVLKPSFLAKHRFARSLPTQPARLAKPMACLVTDSFFPTSGVLTRRTVLDRAGRFDTKLSIVEDRDLWLRLAFEAPVGLVPEVLLDYLTGRAESLATKATSLRWATVLCSVLLRHRLKIEQHLRAEGEQPHRLLRGVFCELGHVCWYADDMDAAAAAFSLAIQMGELRCIPKWLASRFGVADLIRRAKQAVS